MCRHPKDIPNWENALWSSVIIIFDTNITNQNFFQFSSNITENLSDIIIWQCYDDYYTLKQFKAMCGELENTCIYMYFNWKTWFSPIFNCGRRPFEDMVGPMLHMDKEEWVIRKLSHITRKWSDNSPGANWGT